MRNLSPAPFRIAAHGAQRRDRAAIEQWPMAVVTRDRAGLGEAWVIPW